jgi:acetyl esterase/lipase
MPVLTKTPPNMEVHGGSWHLGELGIGRGLMMPLNGFCYASIDYRLSDKAKLSAQIDNFKVAIRWARARADQYNVDPNRIGLYGGAAGGHLITCF